MRYFPIIFALLLAAPAVFSIGVSPPLLTVGYEPGKVYEIPVRISNYNDIPIGVVTRVDGELASSYQVSGPETLPANGASTYKIYFTAPASLDRPGEHIAYVFFKENFIDKTTGTFAVRTEVGVRITVWQPYPGQYAEIQVHAPSVGEGNDTVLTVQVDNLGVEPIADGKATVKVLSPEGVVRDIFTFPGLSIPGSSTEKYFEEIPSSSYPPGKYSLEATLLYGENVSADKDGFVVGKQDIDVLSLEGPLYLDKPVNKFRIYVESLWNLPTENVYGSFTLGESTAQTPPIGITPFGKQVLEGYWETDKTVQEGTPLAKVTVYFGQNKKEIVLPIAVSATSPPPSLPVVQEPSLFATWSVADYVFVILAIVIVTAIVLFAVSKWHRKEEPPAPPQQPQGSAQNAP